MAIAATSLEAPTAQAMPSASRPQETAQTDEELSFWDVLDIVNPLQHLPIVGNIYRAVTGDMIKPGPRAMGDVIFGGPMAAIGAVANVIVEEKTGRDIGGNVIASVFGEDAYPKVGEGETAIAKAGKPLRVVPDILLAGAEPANDSAKAAVPVVSVAADRTNTAKDTITKTPLQVASLGAKGADDAASVFKPNGTVDQPVSDTSILPDHRPLVSDANQPHPSKMPKRDTIPANTAQARQAAAEIAQRRLAAGSTSSIAAATKPAPVRPTTVADATQPAKAPIAKPAADSASASKVVPNAVTVPAVNPGFGGAIDPTMLPDIMMRNLAKYEQAKRTTTPARPTDSLNVSG